MQIPRIPLANHLPWRRRDPAQTSLVGDLVYRAAGDKLNLAIALQRGAEKRPDGKSGSLSPQLLQTLIGPMYPFTHGVLGLPLTPYDNRAIRAERQRLLKFQHQLYVTGQPGSSWADQSPATVAARAATVDRLYGQGAAVKGHEAWIFVGRAASGKSTLSDPIAAEHGALVIDGDNFRDALPAWQATHSPGYVDQEKGHLTKELLARAGQNGDNLVMSYVGHGQLETFEKSLGWLKQQGYTVHLIHTDLPMEKSIERSLVRGGFAGDGDQGSGKLVDPIAELLNPDGPQQCYDALKKTHLIDTYAAYSTDVPRGQAPILLEEGTVAPA